MCHTLMDYTYILVGVTSIMVQCAVDCTRSLFDLGHLSWVHCYRNMVQSECVVVCEWSHAPSGPG